MEFSDRDDATSANEIFSEAMADLRFASVVRFATEPTVHFECTERGGP